MLGLHLYMLQRLSALLLAPLIAVHIGVMLFATQGGLSAAEILGRTQGSVAWALYYGVFVAAAAVHGAIGLRVIAFEWLKVPASCLTPLTWVAGLVLAALGARAVVAVVG